MISYWLYSNKRPMHKHISCWFFANCTFILPMFSRRHRYVFSVFFFYAQAKILGRLNFYWISTFSPVVGEYWYYCLLFSCFWYYNMERNGDDLFCATVTIFAENCHYFGPNSLSLQIQQIFCYICLDKMWYYCFSIKFSGIEQIWWNVVKIIPKTMWVVLCFWFPCTIKQNRPILYHF